MTPPLSAVMVAISLRFSPATKSPNLQVSWRQWTLHVETHQVASLRSPGCSVVVAAQQCLLNERV
jgi:hypothetical protein